MQNKSFWFTTILIVIVAFIVRASVLSASVPMNPSGDEPEYIALAKKLLAEKQYVTSEFVQTLFQGGKTGDLTAFRSPVLPFFLAGHYAIFGDSDFFPRLTLILLSALVCIFLAWSGRMVANSLTGLIAATIWAFYPTAVWSPYSADRYYPEGLCIFFLTGALAFLLAGWRQYGLWKIVVAGLLMGLTVLTRGYLIFSIPLLGLFLLFFSPPRKLQTAAVFTILALLIVGGWVIRNWIAVGKFTLSTQTEAFYFGNNQWARGSFNGDVHTLGWKSPQLKAIKEEYPNVLEMSEVERSNMWAREGQNQIFENPLRFLWLMPRKVAIFFGPFQFWAVSWYRMHYLWLLLFPLGIFALFQKNDLQTKQQRYLLVVPFLAVIPSVVLTFGFDRYRFPVEPVFIVLGAAGAVALANHALPISRFLHRN